jgi:hypothetical protein
MNAILREECEAPVLNNEAIEIHLSYLRPAVEAVQAELPEIRKEIRGLEGQLSTKIDGANKDRAAGDAMLLEKIEQANKDRAAGDAMLLEKIDQANKDRAAGDAMLGEKIDQANKDRAAGDATLGEKIDKLAQRFMDLQASLTGLKWFVASLAVIASGLSIAHSFGWI